MRIRSYMKLAATMAALMLSGDSESAPPPEPEPPRVLSGAEVQLIEGIQAFGLQLFARALEEHPTENVIVSPFSVAMALGMAHNGAAGDTRLAIDSVLSLPAMADSAVNQAFTGLLTLLSSTDSAVQVNIANSLWYRSGFAMRPTFPAIAREAFQAHLADLDFSDPQPAETINSWVSDATRGKIRQIVPDQIDPLMMVYLINAIYFNGTWTTEFDADRTADTTFRTLGGSVITIPMMALDESLPYVEDSEYQAVDLPYGGGRYRLTAILPRDRADVDSLAHALTPDRWAILISSLQTRPGTVFLPRFELAFQISLNSILSNLGMEVAFSPERADFSRLADREDLHISEVLHKTYMKVDEKGTEAAAATSVGIGITSVGPAKFTIRLDRPFLFAVRDSHSGALLFLGRISNPMAE